jgi:hypothetical protein
LAFLEPLDGIWLAPAANLDETLITVGGKDAWTLVFVTPCAERFRASRRFGEIIESILKYSSGSVIGCDRRAASRRRIDTRPNLSYRFWLARPMRDLRCRAERPCE